MPDYPDPNIPLAAGQIPYNVQNQQNAFLQTMLRQQQLRQLYQGQNALREVYGNPENLDEAGRPTPNAMARLMATAPQTGLELQNTFAQQDQRRVMTEAAQGKVSEAHKKTAYEIGVDALQTYDDTLKATNDPRLAQQRMAERRAELLSGAERDNSLQKDQIQRYPPADPVKYRSMINAYQTAQEKPITPLQRIELGYKAAGERRAESGERRAQAEFERKSGEKPENIQIIKPDGTSQYTTGLWDRDNRRWVTADGTNTPIAGDVRLAPRTEGSPQAQAFRSYLQQNPNATPEQMQHFLSQGFRPRSGQSAAVMKYMEEHPDATSDDIAKFVAGVGSQVAATRQFMTGKQGDAIRSFSVADSHLNVMKDAADALATGDVRLINRAQNLAKAEFGREAPIDFDFVRDIVGTEVSKAILGGAGGVTDREELRKAFDKANSPQQIAGVIDFARRLIGGQLEGYRRQFKASTKGSDADFDSLLSDAARRDLPAPSAGGAASITSATSGSAAAPIPPKQGDMPTIDDFRKAGQRYLTNPKTGEQYEIQGNTVVRVR